MKEVKRNGPADLMFDGKMDEAAEKYLDLYGKFCLVKRDRFIGPHILSPLHTCVAHIKGKGGKTFDEVSKHIESMIWEKARELGVEVDKELEMDVSDDISIAREHILAAFRGRYGDEEDDEDDWG